MNKVLTKSLTFLRQVQHSPNRLFDILVNSDLANFKYHWTEILGSVAEIEHHERAKSLVEEIDSLSSAYSKRWADGNFSRWLHTIQKTNIPDDAEVLEIGSYEGGSTNFWLTALPQSRVTCIDTWEGGDEHKDVSASAHSQMDEVLNRFISNTKWAQHRISMHRMLSIDYFSSAETSQRFDLVYIDGSHHGADVIRDAINGFAALKPGGVMMFDDFLWKYYSNKNKNPWVAINFFIRLFKDELSVVRYGHQVHIKKNSR